MDPITILAGAKASFEAVKTAVKYGKDLHALIGDVSKLMGGITELTKVGAAAKQDHGWGHKHSAEELALKAFAARKEAVKMEADIRNLIISVYGTGAWDEITREITHIRKEQAAAAKHEQEVKEEQIRQGFQVVGALMVVFLVGLFIALVLTMH